MSMHADRKGNAFVAKLSFGQSMSVATTHRRRRRLVLGWKPSWIQTAGVMARFACRTASVKAFDCPRQAADKQFATTFLLSSVAMVTKLVIGEEDDRTMSHFPLSLPFFPSP